MRNLKSRPPCQAWKTIIEYNHHDEGIFKRIKLIVITLTKRLIEEVALVCIRKPPKFIRPLRSLNAKVEGEETRNETIQDE